MRALPLRDSDTACIRHRHPNFLRREHSAFLHRDVRVAVRVRVHVEDDSVENQRSLDRQVSIQRHVYGLVFADYGSQRRNNPFFPSLIRVGRVARRRLRFLAPGAEANAVIRAGAGSRRNEIERGARAVIRARALASAQALYSVAYLVVGTRALQSECERRRKNKEEKNNRSRN